MPFSGFRYQDRKSNRYSGPNGIEKVLRSRSSQSPVPNFGKEKETGTCTRALCRNCASRLFQGRCGREGKVSQKPQYVDLIPRAFKGKTSELLEKTDERGVLDELIDHLGLRSVIGRNITELSGGELQRVAIAACAARDAQFYFFDEISPYLDIYQRINAARLIQEISKDRAVLVVEHDLALLDMLTDVIHIAYGEPAGFGVVTLPKSVRVGINQYLKGYLPEENIRIRPESIKFEIHPPREDAQFRSMISFNGFSKKFGDGFSLKATGGNLREGEVLGIVGPNGIGKSTFVKVLAGEIKPDEGDPGIEVKISYKPQYIKADIPLSVQDFLRGISKQFGSSYYEVEISNPLSLRKFTTACLQTSVVGNFRG